MIVRIENRYLKQAIDLLFNLSLKGKESRHRSKLIRLLQKRFEEVEIERKQLAEEFSHRDENGKAIVKHGRYDIANMEEFQKEFEELMSEEIVLEGGNLQETLKTVKRILLNCDAEYSGHEAMVYDYLCEQFEKGDDNNVRSN